MSRLLTVAVRRRTGVPASLSGAVASRRPITSCFPTSWPNIVPRQACGPQPNPRCGLGDRSGRVRPGAETAPGPGWQLPSASAPSGQARSPCRRSWSAWSPRGWCPARPVEADQLVHTSVEQALVTQLLQCFGMLKKCERHVARCGTHCVEARIERNTGGVPDVVLWDPGFRRVLPNVVQRARPVVGLEPGVD